MPAIVDHEPQGGGSPLSVFESGAILLYLARKTRQLIPSDLRGEVETLQWLFWQVAGLGPMAGQNHHFTQYAPEKIPYAIERYVKETNRLYGVLNHRLADRPYVAGGAYTIADIASYPWIVPYERQQQNLDDFPHLKRWFNEIKARPATVRAYERGAGDQHPAFGHRRVARDSFRADGGERRPGNDQIAARPRRPGLDSTHRRQ